MPREGTPTKSILADPGFIGTADRPDKRPDQQEPGQPRAPKSLAESCDTFLYFNPGVFLMVGFVDHKSGQLRQNPVSHYIAHNPQAKVERIQFERPIFQGIGSCWARNGPEDHQKEYYHFDHEVWVCVQGYKESCNLMGYLKAIATVDVLSESICRCVPYVVPVVDPLFLATSAEHSKNPPVLPVVAFGCETRVAGFGFWVPERPDPLQSPKVVRVKGNPVETNAFADRAVAMDEKMMEVTTSRQAQPKSHLLEPIKLNIVMPDEQKEVLEPRIESIRSATGAIDEPA
jgi:hypothetical protein